MKYFETDELPRELLESQFEVTVFTQTFNHERYIRRCLASILAQNFEYPCCLLIIDDCSTDGTARAIHRYLAEAEIPSNFSVFHIRHNTNQYQRGRHYSREVFNAVNSKYFAICEGDDAWTDAGKIKKQHAFLSSDEGVGFSACGHDSVVCDDEGKIVAQNKLPEGYRRDFDSESLRRCNCWCLTNTIFFRGGINLPVHLGPVPNGDNVLWSSLGFTGGFKFLEGVGKSIYTIHRGGVWSQKPQAERTMMQAETHLILALHYFRMNEIALAEHFLSSTVGLLDSFRSKS